MVSLERTWRLRSSASDSNLRRRKEEWFRLQNATTHGCSDSGFQGSNLAIAARLSPFTTSCVHRFLNSSPDLGIDAKKPSRTAQRLHRFLISGPNLGIDAAPSLQHRRTARLQRSRGVQAGTGCHKGGIILCKKPPEWRQSPPQQRFASDLNFVAAKENGSACSGCSGKNYF